MCVICLGPVCVPLQLLLPFLIGWAHQHGYLTWFKREWVTFRYWKTRFNEWRGCGPKESEIELKKKDCCEEPKEDGKEEIPAHAPEGDLRQRSVKTGSETASPS